MKVSQLLQGCILWHGEVIVGIAKITLDDKFNDCECAKIKGNPLDYELLPINLTAEQELILEQKRLEQLEPED